jgi:membrane-associated phospholipid phosphatase
MAEEDISGHDGNVSMPSDHGGDAFSWSLSSVMRTKDTSRYGGGRGSTHRGGLIDTDGNIGFFLRKGAANTAPGLGSQAVDGVSVTLTAASSCTYVGTFLFVNGTINHLFADPAIAGTWSIKANGLPSETWAEA